MIFLDSTTTRVHFRDVHVYIATLKDAFTLYPQEILNVTGGYEKTGMATSTCSTYYLPCSKKFVKIF